MKNVMCIVLAAGKGTRMKSEYPKVLHRVCGYPMLYHVVKAVKGCGIGNLWIVVGFKGNLVRAELESLKIDAKFVDQKEQLGTGHAVLTALRAIHDKSDLTLILYGDTPLLKSRTLIGFVENYIASECKLSILTARLPDPLGYGRILRDEKMEVVGIVEEKDATADQKRIREINTGIYCVDTEWLEDAVGKIRNDNAQGEYYLTDIVKFIREEGGKIGSFEVGDITEIEGVNDRGDLACAHKTMERRILNKLMKSGVTVYHPDTVYTELRTDIGKDSIVYPNCSFVGLVDIGCNCIVESGCYLNNVKIGSDSRIGFGSYLEGVDIPPKSLIPPFSVLKG